VEPAADGRTVNVTALRNDADAEGVNEPLSGARVRVEDLKGAVVVKGVTDHFGVCGLPLPADKDHAELVMTVEKDGFNARRLGLNGRSISEDLRRQLYGDL
jgi:hypothetical protein